MLLQPKQIPGASFFREIRAGLTTFATMAYIIAVNVSCGAQYRTHTWLRQKAVNKSLIVCRPHGFWGHLPLQPYR